MSKPSRPRFDGDLDWHGVIKRLNVLDSNQHLQGYLMSYQLDEHSVCSPGRLPLEFCHGPGLHLRLWLRRRHGSPRANGDKLNAFRIFVAWLALHGLCPPGLV